MSEKRRTSNPEVDEQELINQVHMRTMSGAMGLMTPPAPVAESAGGQKGNDIEVTTEPRDYDGTFLVPNVLDTRKATYIGAEIHHLTKWV